MKKLVFAFAALVAVSFASCTGTTQNTEVVDSDTVVVEEVVETVDSVADSLAAGNAAIYDRADDMNTSKAHRGQTTDGSYLTKTCFVPAGKSTTWTFGSMGHQEVAVVAEAGGLVTLKIHVTNSGGLDRRYDDTKAVRRGMPQRKTSFELPTSRRNTVEVEIVNCGQKDCSFVVISN